MKKIIVSFVMICSLLLMICGYPIDEDLQPEPELEVPQQPGKQEPGKQEPGEQIPVKQEPDEQETDEQEPDEPQPPYLEPSEFLDFSLFSKKEIHFYFSSEVNTISCTLTPFQEIDFIQDGKIVKVFLKENLELQTEFKISLDVKDDLENPLSVEVPLFVNDWIPQIEINELRTVYKSPRAEFIEFKVKSAGELDGLRLYIMWDPKKPFIYDFPAIDVKLGEYIVLHLRTLEDVCVNELGEDLSESAGTDSSPAARDLWIAGSVKLLHVTDIVYLEDANGGILDAVILNETPAETWSRGHFADIAQDLFNRGAWKAVNGELPGPLDAVDTSTIKTAATKSISRHEGKENTHSSDDWYITNNGGASPGQPNK
jgi:hypothetical protein